MNKQCTWCLKFNITDPDYNCCKECVAEQTRKYARKAVMGEWGRHAATEKNAYASDVLQPTKKDGTINKHFVDVHGTKSIEKEMKLTKKEIRENVERYG